MNCFPELAVFALDWVEKVAGPGIVVDILLPAGTDLSLLDIKNSNEKSKRP